MIKIIRVPTKSERFRERIEMVLRNDNSAEEVVNFIDRFLRVMQIQIGEAPGEGEGESSAPPAIGFDIQEDGSVDESKDSIKHYYKRRKK